MYVKVGTYTGDGNADRAIGGIGFQPKFVLIKVSDNSARACYRTEGFAGDLTHEIAGSNAPTTGKINSLDASGFTVDAHAQTNALGKTYYYLAVGGSGVNTVEYSGNSTDNTSIAGMGFQPSAALLTRFVTAGFARHRTSDMPAETGASSNGFDTTGQNDRLQALEADGFQVSADASVNATGSDYSVLGLLAEANVFSVFTYTGDGADDRTITGAGFQPDFVITKRHNATTAAALRFKDEVGDLSLQVTVVGEAANKIQAFTADGFQAGTDISVNANLADYYVMAFKEAAAPATKAPPPLRAQVRPYRNVARYTR
jgi:hypothetical protein